MSTHILQLYSLYVRKVNKMPIWKYVEVFILDSREFPLLVGFQFFTFRKELYAICGNVQGILLQPTQVM